MCAPTLSLIVWVRLPGFARTLALKLLVLPKRLHIGAGSSDAQSLPKLKALLRPAFAGLRRAKSG